MWIKFIFALIPIVWLIISLTALKMPAAKAAVISLILAIILAITAFQLPVVDTLTGTLEGILGGLFPIVYIIVAAMFTSKVTFKSGAMQKIQDMLCGLTTDKRVLVLLIAWGFGGFLEAIAGFGTAVAIPASILMTFGINPIEASVICLVANTTPTAFGAVGLPVITLSQTAGADGVYVTNHGGREIDGAPATIDVLPEVVEAVNGRCPVIFDGGVRRGSHVFKALALGADLVGIGRPYLYGLALGGPHGVASVINELNDELKIDMQLTGCKTIEDVKHARLTDFQYAGDTKPSSTDPRVRKPYPVTAVNQIKSEPDAATGASHH